MVNKKLIGLVVVVFAICFADYSKIYVPDGFEASAKYKMKTFAVRAIGHIARLGGKLNLGHEATLFRQCTNAISTLVRLFEYKSDAFVTRDTRIDTVNVRIYSPSNVKPGDKLPLMIYFHGGVYILGNLDSSELFLYGLTKQLQNVIIISVDYHLAPEYPWPRPVDDCFRVTEYVMQHPSEFNIDPKRVVLAGDSAGGNAVAAVTQKLVKINRPMPKLQVLIYPWVQMYSTLLPSDIYYGHKGLFAHVGFPLARYLCWLVGILNPTKELEAQIASNNHTLLIEDENLRRKYQSYLDLSLIPDKYKTGKSYYDGYTNKKMQDYVYPKHLDNDNILRRDKSIAEAVKKLLIPEASPSLADDSVLRQLPKAFIVIIEWDQIKDQGLIYAERLRRNGVDTTVSFYENAFHGIVPFVDYNLGYDVSRTIANDLVKYLQENL